MRAAHSMRSFGPGTVVPGVASPESRVPSFGLKKKPRPGHQIYTKSKSGVALWGLAVTL